MSEESIAGNKIAQNLSRAQDKNQEELKDEKRRKLITTTAYSAAGVGLACAILPLVDSMNPSTDVVALSSIEVDISNIKVGEEKKVMWRGKPIFIRRRNAVEIAAAQNAQLSELKDPELDSNRVKSGKDEWLITIGICTHLGCIPIMGEGDYKGWFCPCHGSQYDTSGRIRKGPAPKNLEIPPYEFKSETLIKIG
jgi:ubiquinol-cytochrome c reductase iron-sulfur subunit